MARDEHSQDRSVAMILYRNQAAVARLPPVGTLWRWQDAVGEVGQSVLQRLESAGLVERVHGSWWSATDGLAGHMRSNHGRELRGSPGVGQRTFDAPGRPGANAGSSSGSGSQTTVDTGSQVTLTGDAVDSTGGSAAGERLPREWRAERRRHPSEWDGQMSLQDIDDWLFRS